MDSAEINDMDGTLATKISPVATIAIDSELSSDVDKKPVPGGDVEDVSSRHQKEVAHVTPERWSEIDFKCESMQVFVKVEPIEVESSENTDPFKEIPTETVINVESDGDAIGTLADDTSIELDTKINVSQQTESVVYQNNEKISCENESNLRVPVAENTSKMKVCTNLKKLEMHRKCPKCDKVLSSRACMRKHLKLVHSKNKRTFPCPEPACDKTYSRQGNLNYHSLVHTDVRKYNCTQCEKSFKWNGNLVRHIWNRHDNYYECDVCSKRFDNKRTLWYHLMRHNSTVNASSSHAHICKICSKLFPTASTLTQHFEWHIGDKKYECNICDARFVKKWSLKNHCKSHVNDEKNLYPCRLCDKWYGTEEQLARHVSTRHRNEQEFPYLIDCPYCSKVVKSKSGLAIHINAKHPEKKSKLCLYNCEECNASFKAMAYLKMHMAKHAREEKQLDSYECEICEETFSSTTKLEVHLKCHVLGLVKIS